MSDELFFNQDDLARLTAATDQMRQAFKEIASGLRGFYDGLKSEGFSHEDAMELCGRATTGMFTFKKDE